jgi:rubrerythrin
MIELETELGGLYGGWAEVFEADEEAAFLFFKLSCEEKGHANLVDYHRRVVQKARELDVEVEVDLAGLRATIAGIREVRGASTPPSIVEALAIALRLEFSAAEGHNRNALRVANAGMTRLLRSLGGEDEAHLTRLEEFAVKRGVAIRP